MSPTPVGVNADKSRGNRLKKIISELGTSTNSPASRARFLGVDDSKYRRYEAGANIPNDLLAQISELGGDIRYVLTGKRSSLSEPVNSSAVLGAGFEHFAKCVGLLADIGEMSQVTPALQQSWKEYLCGLEQELAEARKEIAQARGSDSPAVQAG